MESRCRGPAASQNMATWKSRAKCAPEDDPGIPKYAAERDSDPAGGTVNQTLIEFKLAPTVAWKSHWRTSRSKVTKYCALPKDPAAVTAPL
jgi:hypothetical protein